MLTLIELRSHDEAQRNASQRMDDIFRQAGEEERSISPDLCGDLIAKQKQAIKEEALKKIHNFFAPMVDRARTAAATREFYEPDAVRRRALRQVRSGALRRDHELGQPSERRIRAGDRERAGVPRSRSRPYTSMGIKVGFSLCQTR
jgi:hypothetical protein